MAQYQILCNWFKAIKNKNKSYFIKFGIAELYPSISKEILSKAIKYAQSVTSIEGKVIPCPQVFTF